MDVMMIILLSVLVVIVFQACKFFNWVWFRPRYMEEYLRKQGLIGNSYKFFYGDMKEIASLIKDAKSSPINISDDIVPRVFPFDHKSVSTYGKSFVTWLGPRPMVYIMDPDLAKDAMSRFIQFQKVRGGDPLNKLLVTGLLDYEGDKWSKHRKIVNPAFHVEKLKNMLPAFDISCSEMISKWEKLMSKEGQCELDVWPYLQALGADVISRTAFGSSYEEGQRIFELQRQQGELVIQDSRSLYIPGSRFWPTKRNKLKKEIAMLVNASIRKIIDKKLSAMKEEGRNEDLLGILLESNKNEVEQHGNRKYGMSIEDVIEECKLFYLAGQETTSTLLVWTMVLLSTHPSWQERARDEVFQLFGKKKPDLDGLNRLKVVSMILYEVLRLYPPAPGMTRMVHEETKLGDITLPAGAFISLPILMIHHDSELWGVDVKEFKPERFSEGVSKATKGQFSYFPFSAGPRVCIGQNFAMLEAKMAVAMVLQRFSFTLSPSYTHAPHAFLTLQPQHGAHLILKKVM